MGKYDRPGNSQVKIAKIKNEILKLAKTIS
jgi:hypothetical protein